MTTFKKISVAGLIMSTLAGLLYSSWPLGYWLNPLTARRGLASGLEAMHQPYNWLFVLMDIISSLLLAGVVYWATVVHQFSPRKRRDYMILGFVSLFALATIADALLPEGCIPDVQQCGSLAHNLPLLIHGFFSVSAAVFLFLSLFVVWYYDMRSPVISIFIVAYAVFGIISLVEAVAPGDPGNWSQHYYLTLCSAWMAYLPWAIHELHIKSAAGPALLAHRRPKGKMLA